jgi:hypothetical protein
VPPSCPPSVRCFWEYQLHEEALARLVIEIGQTWIKVDLQVHHAPRPCPKRLQSHAIAGAEWRAISTNCPAGF